MSSSAAEAKNKGNAAFTSGDYSTAIKHFSEAITLDPSNHVLYSNRSGAYASMGKYEEALKDANKTVELNDAWSKGYSRKGAALHGLERYKEAIEAYDEGLSLEPGNAACKKGKEDAMEALRSKPDEIFGNLLKGDILGKLRAHPKTAAYCHQPDFINIVNNIQANPQLMNTYLGDPRVAAMLGVLLGIDLETRPGGPEPMEEEPPKPTPKKEESSKPKEPVKELNETEKKAHAEKDKGTDAYKKKDFETALKHYTKAIEIDPEDMVHTLNRAAVYLETGKYDECVKDCNDAIEVGRRKYADYKLIARAFARMGNAYMKQEKYGEAIDAYNKSLTENRTPDTLALLQKAEKLKKERDIQEYINPELSVVEKEKGNEAFKKGLYPEAVAAYTEAIKRNPADHTLYSNRAAAYTKLMEFVSAVKDCDECLRLNPDFVKAYIRKGNAQFFMKEYHKCLETYEKGLKLDKNNSELQEGYQKTIRAINQTEDDKSQSERASRSMQDPEIQAILKDPMMQQVLNDLQNDPKSSATHLRNPTVAAKLQKLIAAGILKTS